MRVFTLLLLLTLSGTVAMSQDRVPQLGVPVQAVRMIRFYPNPASTFIMARGYSFQVYNFLGKKVADLQEVTSRTRIDLSNFSRGIYIYQLKDATGKVVESGKFQVEK
jgi:hypothetical protein